MSEFTLVGFVAKLGAIEHDMKEIGPAIIRKACQMVADEAKRVIGEGYEYWPALKPETLGVARTRHQQDPAAVVPDGRCGPHGGKDPQNGRARRHGGNARQGPAWT